MGLYMLLAELHERVLENLPSTRDLGRAACVCRAWRAGDSPVERVLRRRIKARGGAASYALPPVAAGSMAPLTHRLCLLDSISAAQAVSGVMSVSMGKGSTASAAVNVDGHLCVWGELSSAARNAEPIFSYQTPTVVQTDRVKCVSCGGLHILALTDAGEVLSFGQGNYGQLGHGDQLDQRDPKVVEALRGKHVNAIAAGNLHSLVLTREGLVYSFGRGKFGRLGHGNHDDLCEPKVIEALCGRHVTAIVAGHNASMALTAKGAVISFGSGPHGMIGQDLPMSRLVPSAIETLGNRHVLAIAMGREHTIVLTDEGDVLSFGYGGFGALGHGDSENQLTPKVVEALRGRRVVAISAGVQQSLVLTDNGAVLSCGSRCTSVHRQCQYEPKVVEALRDVHVMSGYTRYETWHVGTRTMVLTDEGLVLSLDDGKKDTTLWTLARLRW